MLTWVMLFSGHWIVFLQKFSNSDFSGKPKPLITTLMIILWSLFYFTKTEMALDTLIFEEECLNCLHILYNI